MLNRKMIAVAAKPLYSSCKTKMTIYRIIGRFCGVINETFKNPRKITPITRYRTFQIVN